jgi:hypothetical protein
MRRFVVPLQSCFLSQINDLRRDKLSSYQKQELNLQLGNLVALVCSDVVSLEDARIAEVKA